MQRHSFKRACRTSGLSWSLSLNTFASAILTCEAVACSHEVDRDVVVILPDLSDGVVSGKSLVFASLSRRTRSVASTSKLCSTTRKPGRLLLLGVNTFVKDETILGRKLARASSSSIALMVPLSAHIAWNLTLFELLSVRLSSMTSTASPRAGILVVAVIAFRPCFVRDVSVISSDAHLSANDCSSSEVAEMPFSMDEGLARNVKRMRSCPDRAGSRPPPQPADSKVEMHSKQSSSALTGTCREILST